MPTYDYVCDGCQHEFEQFQSIKDDPLKKCPKCTKNKLRRRIGAGGGFIFKGSGFYITDYRSESYKESAKKDSEADSKPATSSDSAKSETKADSTPSGSEKTRAEKPATEKPAKKADKAKPKKAGKS